MLAAESISNEMGLNPYWNEQCEENSLKLWLPTKTALQDSGQTSSNLFSSKTVESSWFRARLYTAPNRSLPRICLQSSTSSLVECTDLGSTAIKSKKIRVYPTKSQRIEIKSWQSASRWFFNKAKEIDRSCKGNIAKYDLAKAVMEATPEWAKSIPYQIKRSAVLDYWKAKSNAIKKFKQTNQIQQISFRSAKSPKQSCYIPKTAVKRMGVYHTILGRLEAAECIGTEIDCRLTLENGRYYLTVGQAPQAASESQASGIVAIDPGVRTFVTFYSDECCGKLGEHDLKKIFRLCMGLDKLISKRALERSHRKRNNMKRAIWRLRNKIKDLVDDLHHKTALFLCRNFKTMLLPTFETKQMTERAGRAIGSKSARQMLTFAHFRFKQFLKHKAKELSVVVIDVNEAYTSKTVSWTGEIKEIGSSKVITSGKGKNKVVVDRDYNGARGIMLRALRGNSLQVVELPA